MCGVKELLQLNTIQKMARMRYVHGPSEQDDYLSSNTSTSMLAAGEGVWECEGETKSHLKAACAVGEGTP